jgi:fructose-bisphosphate aldolase class II
MARSREGGFAVGAFNVDNLETLRAVCRAARATGGPVLIELSQPEVEVFGLENARDVLDNEIDALGIEAYLNLDHAPSGSAAMSAIDAGFEFVHLDLFQSDRHARDEAVIAATREVVEYARRTGAVVEGEPRYLTGTSTLHHGRVDPGAVAPSLSTPEEARAFVEATGIDTLAVGIGNVHGHFAAPKVLDLELLARVRAAVDPNVNISLHGGSGTRDGVYRAIARGGVSKININSDIRVAYRTGLERQFARYPGQYATAKLIGPVIDAVQRVVEGKIHAFGSMGKARSAITNLRQQAAYDPRS